MTKDSKQNGSKRPLDLICS